MGAGSCGPSGNVAFAARESHPFAIANHAIIRHKNTFGNVDSISSTD